MKAAYPFWETRPLEVRERIEAGDYSLVYEWLKHPRSSSSPFSASEVLAILGDNGETDAIKLQELLAEAQKRVDHDARQPLRVQLETDFLETYTFEPAVWY